MWPFVVAPKVRQLKVKSGRLRSAAFLFFRGVVVVSGVALRGNRACCSRVSHSNALWITLS